MPALEQWNARVVAPIRWGRPYAQPCLNPGCDNVLKIDQLDEGTLWMCAKCNKVLEFYDAYAPGPGGRIKYGTVRLLLGDHVRASGEPLITEFLE